MKTLRQPPATSIKARPVRFDADLRNWHGLLLRHGETPSPQRGEGWGEGDQDSKVRNPLTHPAPRWGEREPAALAGTYCGIAANRREGQTLPGPIRLLAKVV